MPAALTDAEIQARPELLTAYRAQLPRAYLAFGFTTVVDLSLQPETRAWFEAAPQHPRLYNCGPGVGVAGGYGGREPPPKGMPPNLVYEPAAAKAWPADLAPSEYTPQRAVERAAAGGARCVKVFVEPGFGVFNWPTPQPDTLAALKRAARARGLLMVVHATGTPAWRAAVAARADVIVHGLWVWPGDRRNPEPSQEARAAIAAAAQAGMRVQPTLQVIRGEGAGLDRSILQDPRLPYALPDAVLQTVRARAAPPAPSGTYRNIIARTHATFRLMREAGMLMILGSDTPAAPGSIGYPPGLNGRLEIQDWADAGASPAEILRAATLDNARLFGLARELGTIERGKRADLLLLGRDPLADVSAYDSLETIFVGGVPIARETLRPAE